MAHHAAVLLTCFVALKILSVKAVLSFVSLKDVDPGAVCTDGSPAGYYWEAGNGGPSWYPANIWIMYLQGGDWCHNQWSCHSRCGSNQSWQWRLCSSTDWGMTYPDTIGALSAPEGSPLAGANKVFVRYCTSDAYMGNTEAFGFQFRGARVIQAVLTDLVKRRGLGSALEKDRLVFGGFSAGARGAMVHLDYVPQMLGSVAQGVDVVGLLDSPVWTEMPYFEGRRYRDLKAEAWNMHRWANISHLGEDCLASYNQTLQWRCLFGEYRLPFVKSPYLLIASQYDAFQLSSYIGHKPHAGGTPAEQAYTKVFADRTVEFLQKLKSPIHAVFSWACWSHAVTQTIPGFTQRTCNNGTTVINALEQLLDLEPRVGELEWIERCSGFACGTGCRAHRTYTDFARTIFLRRFGIYTTADTDDDDVIVRPAPALAIEATMVIFTLASLASIIPRAARRLSPLLHEVAGRWKVTVDDVASIPLTDPDEELA